jgi:hypothetical protein
MQNNHPTSTCITPLFETRLTEFCPCPLRLLGTVAACGTLIALAGCCTARHPVNPGAMVEKYHFETNSFQQALLRPGPAENVDMLILSGGGSHGAWGAGVLRGWRANAAHPRPKKFAVVTGVSTGALLATYAFLGEPADDDLLENAYTTARTSDIYKKKCIVSALFSDSLYNSKPLAKRIKKFISPETVDRVAQAGQEGRRLYVGTVSHDRGSLVIWDLTALAMDKANPHRVDLYRQVVLASASIPILVQPVQIDGELYADGGARAQLFFEKRFFPAFQKMKEAQRLHPNLTLHVIVNGKLGLERTNVNDCLKEIALRTVDMLLDANEIGDLYHIEYVLKLNHYGHFALSWIPTEVPVTSSEEFDPAMMRKLYEAGRNFGESTAKWPDMIPDLDLNRH